MNKGIITNIQRFSINDGPGIRTNVFLKGCPLRCAWCHNPETHMQNVEVMHNMDKCVGCGECVKVCENNSITMNDSKIYIDNNTCIGCGKCVDICEHCANEIVGYSITDEEVVQIVLKDEPFYDETQGGITLSGGEPFMQFEFMQSILKLCKDNFIHTAVETCGYTSIENIKSVIDLVDIFLFDIKLIDNDLHKKYTGVKNNVIIENLRYLIENKANVEVRIPLISVDDQLLESPYIMANTLCELGVNKVWLLPYHNIGVYKYSRLNREYMIKSAMTPTINQIDFYKKVLVEKGLVVEIEGEG